MGLTMTTADAALKEDYQPAVREQINNKNVLLAQIEKNTEDTDGRRAVLSLHVTRSSGVGARADGGTLPDAGNQGYAEERIPLFRNYGRIEVTGQTVRSMKRDATSFTRAVDSETKGITKDLRRDVNRQAYGTSNGVIASYTNATTGTAVITLNAATTAAAFRQLEVGMTVDGGTVAAPTADFGVSPIVKIVSSNFAALTVTVDSAVTQTNASKLFRHGNGGATGGVGQKEITGLQSIVLDSGTLFNVDPTVNPVWKAVRSSNSSVLRAPTENLFAAQMHAVEIANGDPINLWITTDGVFRAYSNNLTALKRFPGTLALKGGFSALSITAGGGEVGFTWDRDCPGNTAFGLDTEDLVEFQASDWEWMDEDGAVLSRVANKDAYEATLFKYHELATDQRNAHVVVVDLLEA